MSLHRRLCAGGLGGVLALASPVSAQQPPVVPIEAEAQGEETEDGPRNELALVLAGTRERAEGETCFTIGGEYARRLSARFGIVGEFEYVSGPDSWVFAAPVVFQPVGGFKLFAGPGLERKPMEGEAEEGASEPASSGTPRERLFLWRVGTGYAWEFSERFVLSPNFYMDFLREEASEWTRAFVFGISIGVVF